ncbi:hypothetical protein GOODEAATRI_014182, partial [Goodea atripinnis]
LTRSSCSRYELDLVRNLSTMGASPNWMQNQFGRKPVLFGSIAILSVFSSAVAFAPSWPVFTVLFFMLGLGQIACYIVVFVLGSEILVGSSRVLFCSLGQPFVYVISMMLLPGTAYLVRSWRHLSLTMALPGLACIPLWWFSMSICYFGLSFSMSTLYGNPFLNYFLLTAVELPAVFASWLAARSFPRRLSFISFSLLGALALLFIQVTMHSEYENHKIVFFDFCINT